MVYPYRTDNPFLVKTANVNKRSVSHIEYLTTASLGTTTIEKESVLRYEINSKR